MGVMTITGLTLREAIRRKTLLGALLIGFLVLGLSFLLTVTRHNMLRAVENGHSTEMRMAMQLPVVRSVITSLCVSSIKTLGALFAMMMAGGAISSEIERGLLAVILPRPIARWQILLGKWIGLNLILAGSVLLWSVMLWASLTYQIHQYDPEFDTSPLLKVGPVLALFPVIVSTLALSLSTFAQRLLGTTLAMIISAFAWFDGIFNTIGTQFDTEILHHLANFAGLVLPQGYISWWVEDILRDTLIIHPSDRAMGISSRVLTDWGAEHLHFERLDAVYLVSYVVVVFIAGAIIFQRRDV